MTTIAVNRKEMAADSRSSDDTVYYATEGKITRVGKDLIGACGNLDSISKFLHWYETKGDMPDFEDDDFEAAALTHEGIFIYCNSCRPRKLIDPFYATGSGQQAALAAMHLGHCPRRAVEIAIRCDKNSGPPVVVLRLKR